MAHTTRERVLPAAMLMFVVLMLPEPACRSSSRACGPCNTAHAAAHLPPMTGGRLDLALFVFIPEKQQPVWTDGLAMRYALREHGGFRVRTYNLMDATGEFVDATETQPGGIRGLSLDALAKFSIDVRKGYNPHAVLVMDFGSYRTSHIGAHLYPPALWVLEAGDDPQSFAVNAWLARQFDVVLSPDKPSVRLYEETAVVAAARSASGANTSAGEAEIGYSAAVLGTPPGEADFRGPIAAHWLTHHAGIYEHDLDAWLANPGPRDFYVVTTCGNRGTVPEIGRRLGDDVFVSRRVPPGMPHHRLLASARIVINQAKWGEITRRIFEAMAAGALVVTDRLRSERGLGELFVEGEDIIVYDSVDEAVAKVRYYLEHEAERAAIASRAQVKVLQHHTARARAAQVHALLHYHLRSGTMGSRRRPNMPRVCRPVVASDSGSKAIVCVGGPTDGVTNSVFAAAAAGCAELDSLHLPCVKAVAASLSKMVCDGKLAYVNGLSGDPAVWCPPLAGFHKADQPPVWLDHDG